MDLAQHVALSRPSFSIAVTIFVDFSFVSFFVFGLELIFYFGFYCMLIVLTIIGIILRFIVKYFAM